MAFDGNQYSSRVDHTTERNLYRKVVDNVLSTPTLITRLMGRGKPMQGKTEDVAVKISQDTQGEWFTGLETLNSSASTTTILLSYGQTAFTQPKVSIMLESFANAGSAGSIPLDRFKFEEAAAESIVAIGAAIYGSGTSNQPNGLGNVVNDSGTIGGQSRTTYPGLSSTVTASGGTLTLAKMATLEDTISSGSDTPNIGVTTKTVWSLYEQLLSPTVRAEYNAMGSPMVSVRGNNMERRGDFRGNAGFTSLSYRGMPIIKDDYATSGVLFFLNEKYFHWAGRSVVPDEYKSLVEKVDLGSPRALESDVLDQAPSNYNGWFYQKPQVLPNQAGTIARFYVIGQFIGTGFRRSGKLTGITSV